LCGIAGIISKGMAAGEREEIVGRMVRALNHRGPDEQAVISDGDATFGVARLSIIDRAKAHQPMLRRVNGRSGSIAYNGEVYNFSQLRAQLAAERIAFSTESDTEVVLNAHLHYGLRALELFDGMFAYAVWDEARSELILARDRLGIKPLFYIEWGDTILFASEPKALFCHTRVQPEPNHTAILEYFLHGAAFAAGYVTGERSFYDGVKSLPPGHFLIRTPRGSRQRRYWSPVDEMKGLWTDEHAAEERLAEIMTASVREMLVGEVPVGTALSGGLDSSFITAEAARYMREPLDSACITYRADHKDPDAYHATLLSEQLNLERPGSHRLDYTYLSEDNYLNNLDAMVMAFDEPHWELRQLAMFENYRTLSQAGCTIVLTGEGADELFFGYYRKFPGFRAGSVSSPGDFARLWEGRLPFIRRLLRPAFANGLISNQLPLELIEGSISAYFKPCWEATGSRLRAVQSWYLHTFLPWLLMDNDRCSMAHSLEGRFPFLSNEMISFALQIPPEWNIAEDGEMQEKVLLRRAASKHLPQAIWRDRLKSPLPVPHAVRYHLLIMKQLSLEIERAGEDLWQILDKETVIQLVDTFDLRALSVAATAGEALTEYIPLEKQLQVRTAQLFAILTFLRWYEMCIQNRKEISCSATTLNGNYRLTI
jgi:asparagine synthase (glutamine-hydrolysing)